MKVVDTTKKLHEKLVEGIDVLKLKKDGYHPDVGHYHLLSAVIEQEVPKRFLWKTWTKIKKSEVNLLLVVDNHRVEISREDLNGGLGARVSKLIQEFETEAGTEVTLLIVENLMYLPTPTKEKGKKK